MSTTKSTIRREAIHRTLAQRAGSVPDASAIAEATLSTWRQMVTWLTPVIGAQGVDVLFSRSLHVTSKAFPWLAIAGNDGTKHTPLARFKACIEARETDIAAEVSIVLLVTFTELVATLIGESLTERLLDPVWTFPPS